LTEWNSVFRLQPLTQLKSKENSYGIVEYTPQAYIPSDLDIFARNFTPRAVGYRPKLESIDGGYLVPGSPYFDFNGESNLDLTCV
jgi:tripeptidyl-peptidase-1